MQNDELRGREQEKSRQRREMLEAAHDLFSKKRYHDVSMYQIAKKARFAIGTVYKVFHNKADLYKTLVLEQYDRLLDALAQALEEPDDEVEKLRNYIRTKSRRFREDLPFMRLFLAEHRGAGFNISSGLDGEMRKRNYMLLRKVAGVFEKGMGKTRFNRIADPFALAVVLDSSLDALLLLWLDAPRRHAYPEDPDVILNILFRGLTGL